MIAARLAAAAVFADRLADRAGRLAAAVAERRLREQRGDPARWRGAALLWPLFTGAE